MTKLINLKADLSTITENEIYGHNVSVQYPGPLRLEFTWHKINGVFPEKLITEKQVYITYEDPDQIAGVGNGKPSEELIKLLKENGNLRIEQDYRTLTHEYLPRYNYDHIHEEIICPSCERSYSTEDIVSDYNDDGSKYYTCIGCDEILDIILNFEEIADDKEFDFIIEKI